MKSSECRNVDLSWIINMLFVCMHCSVFSYS